MPRQQTRTIRFGRQPLSIAGVLDLARGSATAELDDDADLRRRIRAGVALLEEQLGQGRRIYGVTTGVGESVSSDVEARASTQLSLNLIRLHGCGTGPVLDEQAAAAVIAVRLASLARGYSGVREVVLERLCDLLNHRVLPVIPSRGSVGASGDLTPLSYLAAVLTGERQASFQGEKMEAKEALRRAGIEAIVLAPKEGLALMNGTSMTTALACLAFERCWRLARFAAALTAMASDVLRGNPEHFDARIFELKPFPGSIQAAAWIREDLELPATSPRQPARLQDRYSVRCAPHVIGMLVDALLQARPTLETEINSVNDNPIVDGEGGRILHGGNFYGGHIGQTMETLKTAVAGIADLLDRQLQLVCSCATSHGLSENLVASNGAAGNIHHGFKAITIAASALAAEALSLTMPASAFSRSTENHNQDKVPMAPLAARSCLETLELAETVGAMVALAYCQAVDLRGADHCHRRATEMRTAVRDFAPLLVEDRPMDREIGILLDRYGRDDLPIGEVPE